jgi:uncharacterized protein (DUF58 family)
MKTSSQLTPPTVGARGRAPGRISFAFGRRFFLLLLMGLVWLGPAWSNPRFLFAMLAWDAVVFCAWGLDLRRLPRQEQLEMLRVWNSTLQLTCEATLTLQLLNRSECSITAEVQDDVPVSMRGEIPNLTIIAPHGGMGTGTYDVCPRERGDATFGAVSFRYQSAWQLAERWASAATKQTIRIYPNLEESKRDTIYLIRSRQIALEKRHKHLPGQGREFESLREYRETDEWRDICWSATARRAKLISKSYQIERSQTVWLVLDAGRLLRARVLGLSKLDYAVGAALSLAQVALYSGDKIAMLAYGRRVQHRLPAGRGPSQVRALLEALAQVRGEELEADHRRAVEALAILQKRRSLVVWLTDLSETATTPEVVESAVHLARRHLVLFTVIGQPELRGMLRDRPKDAAQMFRIAAAQEIVQRRDILLRTLRQQGALTLEVDPTKLSSTVVNQYLLAKERSLI